MNVRGKDAAALALHRFGFGSARDSIAAIAGDPRGALLADLDRPSAGSLISTLPSSAEAARVVSDFRAEEQAKKKLDQRAKKEADANKEAKNEAKARYEAAIGADIGFVERLVWFWSNHFCVSADKDIAMVGGTSAKPFGRMYSATFPTCS